MKVSEAARPLARVGRSRWIVGALLLVVVAPVLWYVVTRPIGGQGAMALQSQGGDAKGVGPRVDYEAPNFRLKDASGQTVELKQFRGKAVLLNFWATWCIPCRDEMPEMEQLYRQLKDSGSFVVLAVSIDSEAAARDVPEYLKAGDPKVGSYTFPVALDSKQEVARAYRLGGVPASFFIDGKGIIRAVQPGAMNHQTLLERARSIVPSLSS
jgi:peroxiredoxin